MTRAGRAIDWPEPTHARPNADGTVPGGLLPWRTAAECIDWELECPSIFSRARPLAESTLRRVARGVMRYVVNAEKPFIVGVGGRMGQSPERGVDQPAQTLTAKADSAVVRPFIAGLAHGDSGGRREYPIDEPLTTVQAGGNNHAVVQPFISRVDQTSAADRNGIAAVEEPLRTLHTVNSFALIAPLTHQGGERGQPPGEPLATVTAAHRGEQALIAAHVTKFRGGATGAAADAPMPTVTANGFVKRPGGAAPLGLVSAALVPRYGERPGQAPRARPGDQPMATVVPTQNGASLAAVSIARQFGASVGSPAGEPIGTTTAGGSGKSQLVGAFLAQHNTGNDGHDARTPLSTIVGKGCTQGVVEARAALLSHACTSNTAGGNGDPAQPAKTITAGGTHHAVVACDLSAEDLAGAERVAAFIAKYYGQGEGQALDEPQHTVTTKDRFALVTVHGWPIVDIGLRMLQPRELYRAQGFPAGYVIDGPGPEGKPMTKTAQVRMCGNSVCPPIAQAIARAVVFGSAAGRLAGAAD